VTVLRQLISGEKTQTATIVLRGPTANNLNDLESAIDAGMNLIKFLSQADMKDMLQRVSLRGRSRGVIVLPADEADTYSNGWVEMEIEWLDRIHGGRGGWDEVASGP